MRVFLILALLASTAAAQPAEDASPLAFLLAAKSAVEAGQWADAEEALARAETRVLTRSERPSRAGAPSAQQIVRTLQAARQAAAQHDRAAATEAIGAALADTNSD